MRDEWISQTESHGSICFVNMLTNEREYYFLTYEDWTRLPNGWKRWSTNDETSYRPFITDTLMKIEPFSELTWIEPLEIETVV